MHVLELEIWTVFLDTNGGTFLGKAKVLESSFSETELSLKGLSYDTTLDLITCKSCSIKQLNLLARV